MSPVAMGGGELRPDLGPKATAREEEKIFSGKIEKESLYQFGGCSCHWGGKRLRSHHDALSPLRALLRPIPGGAAPLGELPLGGRPRAVYVHVPFCRHNCTFCNLNRCCAPPPFDYVELVCRELAAWTRLPYVRKGSYGAVYFGGGTPTVLPAQEMRRLIRAIREQLELTTDVEITVETTVSDLTEEKIAALWEAGVNRVSVGVQTFCDRGRRMLGRWGSGEEAAGRLEELLSTGFRNVGIDLIYNWPGQREEELAYDLEVIKSLDLAGVSFYPLILHPEAPIVELISSGAYPAMGDLEHEKRLFDLIWEELTGAGFELLEITKLVRPGRDEYRYVAIRYGGGDTLGLGPGAGGKLRDLVYRNSSDLKRYRNSLGRWDWGFSARALPLYDPLYRLVGMVELNGFRWEGLPPGLREALEPVCRELVEQGLLRPVPGGFSLTRAGVFWGHNIARDLAQRAIEEARKTGKEAA